MVFVKVRETYDLHTVKNKMTVIAIHTPRTDILKKNYPGLLMQCRAYRPVSADVKIACASVLPMDPKGVGTTEDDVAPEDLFNPILYKAMSNFGMSQLEARIGNFIYGNEAGVDIAGQTAAVDVDNLTNTANEFPLYYGLLSQTGVWKHANPQQGLEMSGLRPLVYELVANLHDQSIPGSGSIARGPGFPDAAGEAPSSSYPVQTIRGSAKPMPFINTSSYIYDGTSTTIAPPGFPTTESGGSNAELQVPYINIICGCIIIPPSRLHELFYRMVVEWTIEFSALRPVTEIYTWGGLSAVGTASHYQNYSYTSTKEAVTGSSDTLLNSDACMVSANVDVEKVM